jgi:hypothetical protein
MSSKSSRLESWQNTISQLAETVDMVTRLVRSCTRLIRSLAMFALAIGFLISVVVLTLHY